MADVGEGVDNGVVLVAAVASAVGDGGVREGASAEGSTVVGYGDVHIVAVDGALEVDVGSERVGAVDLPFKEGVAVVPPRRIFDVVAVAVGVGVAGRDAERHAVTAVAQGLEDLAVG